MITEAVILAGGFGTRLKTVISDVPKPMAPVNGKPFLHYLLLYLKHYGITDVVMSTGYLADKVEDYFGAAYQGMRIRYARETAPLGTGGGIRLALEQCKSAHVLVLNGDSFLDFNLKSYFEFHLESSADVSMALREVEDGTRYGTILLDGKKIAAFREKSPENNGKQLINAGIYIIRKKSYIKHTPADAAFSIEYDFFARYCDHLQFQGYKTEGYFIDIGLPEDYIKAQSDFTHFKYQ
ncbi:MAG: nucleotidyltransferase family protein [Bacteroidia bacterium]